MRGRPLWFLGTVVTGWTAVRVAMLWPGVQSTMIPRAAAADRVGSVGVRAPDRTVISPIAMTLPLGPVRELATQPIAWVNPPSPPVGMGVSGERNAKLDRSVGLSAPATRTPSNRIDGRLSPAPGLPALARAANPSRWSGSAWAIARDGGGNALLSPLLGGSQAGVRVAYALDRDGRTAVFGRVASPLGRGPAELALGGQWRPGLAPVTFYAEGRASDGRVAPAVGLFGGGATPVFAGFRLEGYGQAGIIVRGRASGYGDGQLRLVRPFGGVEAGVGLWAAAQRGAARVDIGPSVAMPIQAAPVALRLTLDWRHRIAGDARPASGPALSLGADF